MVKSVHASESVLKVTGTSGLLQRNFRTISGITILAITLFLSAACSRPGSIAGAEQTGKDTVMTGKEDKGLLKATPARGSKYRVGYRTLEASSSHGKAGKVDLNMAVWYPTMEKQVPYQYVYSKNKIKTRVAVDGQPAAGKFPLVIYSHGATGCGLSMAFLGERLASEGFLVAAPDYPDPFYSCRVGKSLPKQNLGYKLKMLKWAKDLKDRMLKSGKSFRPQLAYRPKITSAVIDGFLKENRAPNSPFYRAIDEEKIGLVGHSFGAWTAILTGGADSDYRDSRVKAVVSLSSPVQDGVFASSELGNLAIPVMFMYGQKEAKHRGGNDRRLYDLVRSPRFLVEIKGADHFTFSGGIRKEFRTIGGYTERDPRRAAIVDYTVSFLQYYLNKDQGASRQLETKSGGAVSFIKDLGH